MGGSHWAVQWKHVRMDMIALRVAIINLMMWARPMPGTTESGCTTLTESGCTTLHRRWTGSGCVALGHRSLLQATQHSGNLP